MKSGWLHIFLDGKPFATAFPSLPVPLDLVAGPLCPSYWRWACIIGNHLRRGVPLSWWLLEGHWWKLRKAEDRERFPVILLITLLLLMKYGHRGGLVAVYCWGSPWSVVGFVHALRSTVVCGEDSGELQCQTLLRSRSHSTYGSSARSDSHRAGFCPNSVVSGWKN
jgi:hypothetical protein